MDDRLEELATYSVNDLLELLAEELTASAEPLDPGHKRAIGLALLRAWFTKVRDVLCEGTLKGRTSGETVLRDAAAVMDLISSLQGQIPLATFSVLVVKYGLDALCDELNRG